MASVSFKIEKHTFKKQCYYVVWFYVNQELRGYMKFYKKEKALQFVDRIVKEEKINDYVIF